MELNLGKNGYACCALCPSRILFKNPDQTLNLNNYNEVAYKTSLGTITVVGFCRSCVDKAKNDSGLFDSISESMKEGWAKELKHDKVDERNVRKYWETFKDFKITEFHYGTT